MRDLTKRQKDILEFFDAYSKEHGYPPTMREICKKFSIASTNGARYHLHRLKELGYIEIEPYRSRGIRRINDAAAAPRMANKSAFPYLMPILGRVPAGPLALADPGAREDEVGVDPQFFGIHADDPELFGLRVRGDSMIEAGIHDGDVVVVKLQDTAMDGQIVVVREEDEATLKRFRREKNAVVLVPENPKYESIRIPDRGGPEYGQNVGVIGIVVGLIRSM